MAITYDESTEVQLDEFLNTVLKWKFVGCFVSSEIEDGSTKLQNFILFSNLITNPDGDDIVVYRRYFFVEVSSYSILKAAEDFRGDIPKPKKIMWPIGEVILEIFSREKDSFVDLSQSRKNIRCFPIYVVRMDHILNFEGIAVRPV